jgi:hypothetical protein
MDVSIRSVGTESTQHRNAIDGIFIIAAKAAMAKCAVEVILPIVTQGGVTPSSMDGALIDVGHQGIVEL